jgi:hypothetical protein
MPDPAQVNVDLIAQRIPEHVRQAKSYGTGLKRLRDVLIGAALGGSGLATLVAGVTAANGPVIGSGPAGWSLACTAAAVLSLVGGVSAGMKEQLQVSERAAKANECLGRLGALEASLVTGIRGRTEIAAEYENILKAYPDVLR